MLDKLIIAVISPLGLALLLGALALCLAFAKRRRSAWALGFLAWAWLAAWSLPVSSHLVRGALEGHYPPLEASAVPTAEAIVVLGGGISPAQDGRPFPDLGAASDRVWHAARLFHAGRAPFVLLSGGSDPAVSATSEAQAMRSMLIDLGVPDGALLLEEGSRNTRQNALFSREMLRQRGLTRIVLVTSALHMPRAVKLFEAQGLTVIPAATDHEASDDFVAQDWMPSAAALDGSARAIKELVAYRAGR
jgi:uncharacterized SAM-binding protein YcdF (DUF218 family)